MTETHKNADSINHYFFSAWKAWSEAPYQRDWMEQASCQSTADTHLYIAVQLAGLRYPFAYRLPTKKAY